MVSARQEADLRPKLERLDRLIARSEGLDPDALRFDFRPLWQLDAATAATVALQKAQATQVYAGLGLWPTAVTARLVEAQLAEDGTYPNARAVFWEGGVAFTAETKDYSPDQLRDPDGRWTAGNRNVVPSPIGVAQIIPNSAAATSRTPAAGPAAMSGETRTASYSIAQNFPPSIFFEDPPIVPDPGIPYPADPTLPPGPDYVWKGPPGSQPGDPEGSWYNEKTGESLHPDFNHKPGADPHYDYQFRGSKSKGWRWFPGAMVPKT